MIDALTNETISKPFKAILKSKFEKCKFKAILRYVQRIGRVDEKSGT